MNFHRFALISVAAVAFSAGCSNAADAGAPDDSTEGALVAPASTPLSLGIDFVAVRASTPAPADSIDPVTDWNPEPMKTCETDLQYVQISGTKFDAALNQILKGQATSVGCDSPQTLSSIASIKFLGKNLLSVAESGDWYGAGAAHPNSFISYKNLDLSTGKTFTLADILQPAASATLLNSVRAQIGAKKIAYEGPDKKLIVEKLDPDTKAALLSAANYVLKQPLDKISTFSLAASGVRIDLVNELPHVMQGAPSEFIVRWETLDKVMIPAAKERIVAKK